MTQQLKMKTLKAFEMMKNPHQTAQYYFAEGLNLWHYCYGIETFAEKCSQAILHLFSSKADALVHLKLFAWTDFHVTFTLLITPHFSFVPCFCNSIVLGADFSVYTSRMGLNLFVVYKDSVHTTQ
jgi:hypothetical protein